MGACVVDKKGSTGNPALVGKKGLDKSLETLQVGLTIGFYFEERIIGRYFKVTNSFNDECRIASSSSWRSSLVSVNRNPNTG